MRLLNRVCCLRTFFLAEPFALNLMQRIQVKYEQNQTMFSEGLVTS